MENRLSTQIRRIMIGVIFISTCWIYNGFATPAQVGIISVQKQDVSQLPYLKDSVAAILSTRLYWDGQVSSIIIPGQYGQNIDENLPENLFENMDYAIIYSVEEKEERLWINGRVIQLPDQKEVYRFAESNFSENVFLATMNTIADGINHTVFGREKLRFTDKGSNQPNIHANPEKALTQNLIENDDLQPSYEHQEFQQITSHEFDFQIKGISLGDVTGNQQNEIVLLGIKKVIVATFAQNGQDDPTVLAEKTLMDLFGNKDLSLISIDVADVNKNNKAEIYINGFTKESKVSSFILEWHDGVLKLISENQPWLFRVEKDQSGLMRLYGQKKQENSWFEPSIYELNWVDMKIIKAQNLLEKKDIIVTGFANTDVIEPNKPVSVAANHLDYLKVYTSQGELIWKSEETFGGNEDYFPIDPEAHPDGKSYYYLPTRIIGYNLDGKGKKEILLINNQPESKLIFKKYKSLEKGQIIALSWDGFSFTQEKETPNLDGFISDFAVADVENDGQMELLAARVMRRKSYLLNGSSVVEVYQLKVNHKPPLTLRKKNISN